MKTKRTFIIICEAVNPDDLKVIHNYVKSFGDWAHITSSTWAVISDEFRQWILEIGLQESLRHINK